MRPPFLDDGDVRLYLGDCVKVMREMDAESVDAIVCDPPYGIRFMGKAWDGADIEAYALRKFTEDAEKPRHQSLRRSQAAGLYDRSVTANVCFAAWCQSWATEALRVLKPGGHLLASGGTRTFHRLTCGIEDAGFEIRDCLSWLYGSGFPKSLDVSKAIDRGEGFWRGRAGDFASDNSAMAGPNYERTDKGAPTTDAARQWQGWGTALKPAWEPVVVARKPLIGTVAQNVQTFGTGALNVDGCRIGTGEQPKATRAPGWDSINAANARHGYRDDAYEQGDAYYVPSSAGRWPANVCLDEAAAVLLDEQSGERPSGARAEGIMRGLTGAVYGDGGEFKPPPIEASTGGASRFFYTAKASRADRNTSGADNTHPTVKPTDLMRWFVRLVTPPGGIVLDPFAGSGTTLVAARAEGFRRCPRSTRRSVRAGFRNFHYWRRRREAQA